MKCSISPNKRCYFIEYRFRTNSSTLFALKISRCWPQIPSYLEHRRHSTPTDRWHSILTRSKPKMHCMHKYCVIYYGVPVIGSSRRRVRFCIIEIHFLIVIKSIHSNKFEFTKQLKITKT